MSTHQKLIGVDTQEAELVGGPQDGGRVHTVCEKIPQTIYVGRRWLGDGYAAWSRKWSERFPVCYVLDGYKYKFRPVRRTSSSC